jgi:hemerythrin
MPQANALPHDRRSSIMIPVPEERHRELVELLAALTQSVHEGKDKSVLNRIIGRFLDCAAYHFKRTPEEIEKRGYDEHRLRYESEQRLLMSQLYEMRRRMRTADFVPDNRIVALLRNLYQAHVISVEKYFMGRIGPAY